MRLGACQWPRTPQACSDQTKNWEEPLPLSTCLRKGQPAGRATPADSHDDSPATPGRSPAQPTSAPLCP